MTESVEPQFCAVCRVHLALPPNRPICPVCVDAAAREIREGK